MLRERICEAIAVDNYTTSSVAASSDVPRESLHRFCSGKQAGLQFDGVERLCELLDLELVRRVDLAKHCELNWVESTQEYDAFRERYDEEKDEEWNSYLEDCRDDFIKEWEGDGEPNVTKWEDEFLTEEFPVWSDRYDRDHFPTQSKEAFADFVESERERLSGLDWVILKD
ncbi:hypothetical protein [Roseimaritima sediminicola]|uniref:hypothetical protein n=1 Tax=Roseimaritima sediminicola TaxID=2662066 RepID=UPI0012983BD8|nr:hypothetical protein [Roseimaritima sediminicola]